MRKYRLTDEEIIVGCRTLYRIQALRDFGDVKEGEFGGWIESEKNLSHEGSAWVSGNALVYGNARVYGNAQVSGDADIKTTGDICSMSGFGSEYRTTTAFRTKNGDVHVTCGCFYGNLDDFYNRVKETHGDTLYGREYKKMIELIKIHFGIE